MELALADKTERDGREALLEKELTEAEHTIGPLVLENDLAGRASRRLK